MRGEVLGHGNIMWNVMMLSHEVKQQQVLGKELMTSPKWRKLASKHKNTKKNVPLESDSNMPRCKTLQHSNSKLELRKEPKT